MVKLSMVMFIAQQNKVEGMAHKDNSINSREPCTSEYCESISTSIIAIAQYLLMKATHKQVQYNVSRHALHERNLSREVNITCIN